MGLAEATAGAPAAVRATAAARVVSERVLSMGRRSPTRVAPPRHPRGGSPHPAARDDYEVVAPGTVLGDALQRPARRLLSQRGRARAAGPLPVPRPDDGGASPRPAHR